MIEIRIVKIFLFVLFIVIAKMVLYKVGLNGIKCFGMSL